MKKIYNSPNTFVVKLGIKNHLMTVSYGDNSLNSMDYSTETTGSNQLTRENNSVWDEEW